MLAGARACAGLIYIDMIRLTGIKKKMKLMMATRMEKKSAEESLTSG